jgi:hypothetical protein
MLDHLPDETGRPAALILGEVDAILRLGILVARESGYGTIPALAIPAAAHIDLPMQLRIVQDGALAAA